MNRLIIALLLILLCETSWAVCERAYLPPKSKSEGIVLDPPGSFGPFDRTMTLDCLSYVGYKKDKKGEPVAAIKDETGKIYYVKRLEPMGMDRGTYIEKITPARIIIERIIPDGQGKWKKSKPIYMPRIWRK